MIVISTFFLVFLRAMQQQHVIGGNYLAATITPFFIAAAEVASVLLVVDRGWGSIPLVGLGGSMGVLSAMFVYRFYKR
ncbi:conserved hypothetical protein [Gammaproteobacteria bacterium]